MRKKLLFISIFFLLTFFYPKNTLALSVSEYSSRNLCGGKYEVARANLDGTATSIGCYNTYNAAVSAMNNNSNRDLFIFDSTSGVTRIANSKYALLDLSVNPETLTYFYETKTLSTRKYTYMDTGSLYGGVDGALVDVNYGTSVLTRIGGLQAWIKDGVYEIVPLAWVKSKSSYTIGENIKHNYVNKIQKTYSGSRGSVLGPKPDCINKGTYYSYDGHYFYQDLYTMLDDYKSSSSNRAVNVGNPYYNYYMYLPNHSKTRYSSLNIDQYIRENMGVSKALYGDKSVNNSSRLYGQGTYFYNTQEKYGVNALLSLSLSRNESSHGRSKLAITKNNGFGLNAVDSNPIEEADYFPTFASSIYEFSSHWVMDGYADPNDSRYFGPAYGDKYIGMNVKYAADTYWSEKMAANYYAMDKVLGLQDYNYYQLGKVTGPTKAYLSASSMSKVVYTYPEKDDNLLIVGEVSNGEGVWYKVQSDMSISPDGSATTKGEYNWESFVYVKKNQVEKINQAKDGYKYPNQTISYKDQKYTYDLFTSEGSIKPKVAITLKEVSYYYDATLEKRLGKNLLKDKWIMVYGACYNENHEVVSYLVTSDYKYDQKHWIPASSIEFKTSSYGKVNVDAYGEYTWVNSTPHDLKATLISGQFNYSYVPILDTVKSDGYTWYKVPVSLDSNQNSYGYTIMKCPNVFIEKYSYNADQDNKDLLINQAPVIKASNKEIVQGDKIDLLDSVIATDKEDGDLTKNIQVSGSVDIDKVGEYPITYQVTDSKGQSTTKKIIVKVIENQKPEINVSDKKTTINYEFDAKKDVSATDKEKGDLTEKVKVVENKVDIKKLGTYKVTYEVSDGYHTVTKDILVEVIPDQKPVITAEDITISLNQDFDPMEGVSATDFEDGDLTKNVKVIDNNVNNQEEGDYFVSYQVEDKAKNITKLTRKVTVKKVQLQEKNGEFYLENLTWNEKKKSYSISGYLIILGVDNSVKNPNYQLILRNKNTDEEYYMDIDSWLKDVPYDLGSENGCSYENSWFKGELDFEDVPVGDYDIYMKAEKGIYYAETVVSNMMNQEIDRRAEDSEKGYNFKVQLSLKSKKIDLSIRDGGLITTSTSNTFRNMVNSYDNMEFQNEKLHIVGTSYNYGGTYKEKEKITRKLVLENVKTFKQYKFDIGSTKNGSYLIDSTDKKDKTYAWYDAMVDVSSVEKGTYSMIVYTKTSDSEDYGEISDIFASINEAKATLNGKKYEVVLNKERQNRIEISVK